MMRLANRVIVVNDLFSFKRARARRLHNLVIVLRHDARLGVPTPSRGCPMQTRRSIVREARAASVDARPLPGVSKFVARSGWMAANLEWSKNRAIFFRKLTLVFDFLTRKSSASAAPVATTSTRAWVFIHRTCCRFTSSRAVVEPPGGLDMHGCKTNRAGLPRWVEEIEDTSQLAKISPCLPSTTPDSPASSPLSAARISGTPGKGGA